MVLVGGSNDGCVNDPESADQIWSKQRESYRGVIDTKAHEFLDIVHPKPLEPRPASP